jgi:hypothetical protein
MANSSVASAVYTINLPVVATPTFSPASGTYTSVQSYTTDGTTPSQTVGTVYSAPVTVSSTQTIKAIAYKSGMADSTVASAAYTINLPVVATPTFSPAAGAYTSVQTVMIGSTTSGATIRYTTDGTTPSQTIGTLYSTPVTVNATTTITAIAYKSGMTDSTVVSNLHHRATRIDSDLQPCGGNVHDRADGDHQHHHRPAQPSATPPMAAHPVRPLGRYTAHQ